MTIAVAITGIVAVVILLVLSKTTFGYELKATGHNKDAAKYSGMNAKRNIILNDTWIITSFRIRPYGKRR